MVSLVHGLNFSPDTLIRPTYIGSTSTVNVTNLMLPFLHGVRIKDGVDRWGIITVGFNDKSGCVSNMRQIKIHAYNDSVYRDECHKLYYITR